MEMSKKIPKQQEPLMALTSTHNKFKKVFCWKLSKEAFHFILLQYTVVHWELWMMKYWIRPMQIKSVLTSLIITNDHSVQSARNGKIVQLLQNCCSERDCFLKVKWQLQFEIGFDSICLKSFLGMYK